MQKQPFSVGGGSKDFRAGGVTFAGGSVPHYMPWLFQISHNCVTECTLQAKFLVKTYLKAIRDTFFPICGISQLRDIFIQQKGKV